MNSYYTYGFKFVSSNILCRNFEETYFLSSNHSRNRDGWYCKVRSSDLYNLFIWYCSQSLLEMGTADLDFVQLSQLIGRKTGGISVYPSTSAVRGRAEPTSHIIVKGKAMASQTSDLFGLVSSWFPGSMFSILFVDTFRFGL